MGPVKFRCGPALAGILLVAAWVCTSPIAGASGTATVMPIQSSSAPPADGQANPTATPVPLTTPTSEDTRAYPTVDASFADALAARLEAAYTRLAGPDELHDLAAAFAEEHYGAAPRYVFVCDGYGPVVVVAVTVPDSTLFHRSLPYLFWPDDEGTVHYQALDRDGGLAPAAIFGNQPQTVLVTGGVLPEMGVIPSGAFLGQDWGGAYYLLRLEDGAWRVVWDYTEAVEAGQWATRGARAQLVDGLDTIMLLGAVPEAETVPRFFDESTHHAMQQDFLSLWERRGDGYVRTAGQVVESPMRALTEFMVALSAGQSDQAGQRATDAQVVADALALGWDDLDGAGLMVWWSGWRPAAEEQYLGIGASDSWSGVYAPPRQVRLVCRDGRWLVAQVWEVPADTPWPTATPEPAATSALGGTASLSG